MTLANDVILAFPVLSAMFDPADSGFRNISETHGPLDTAVLSVILGRESFWVTHALAFGYAIEIEGSGSDAFDLGQYRQLFGTEDFDDYVVESRYKRDDGWLLATAAVLDSLLHADARTAAMRGTIAITQCIGRCAGDPDCVRMCISGEHRYG